MFGRNKSYHVVIVDVVVAKLDKPISNSTYKLTYVMNNLHCDKFMFKLENHLTLLVSDQDYSIGHR